MEMGVCPHFSWRGSGGESRREEGANAPPLAGELSAKLTEGACQAHCRGSCHAQIFHRPKIAVSDYARIVEIVVPADGYLVALAEIYTDESYFGAEGERLFCIAGYIFKRRRALEFDAKWGKYLHRKGLPYFHMQECNSKTEAFADRDDTVEIATKLLNLTREYTEYGFAVTVREDEYLRTAGQCEGMPKTAYGFAMFAALTQARRWLERKMPGARTAYFYEQGGPDERDAKLFLEWMFESEQIQAKYGFLTHAPMPKATPCLHPADFLAWHWRLELWKREQADRKSGVRKDFELLVRPHDSALDYDLPNLERLERELQQREQLRKQTLADLHATVEGMVNAAFDRVSG